MKSLSYAVALLAWMPLSQACEQPINKNNSTVNCFIGLAAVGVGGYVVYELGKELGFWAYPSVQKLYDDLAEIKHACARYEDVHRIFTHATDPVKEAVLHIMGTNARYREHMDRDLRMLYAFLRKIKGRLQQLRASTLAEDIRDVQALEQEENALHMLVAAIEQLRAHSDRHTDYFKLYKAEQECAISYAHELKLHELYHTDVHLLSAELLNYSTYRYTDVYGFVLLRNRLRQARKTYGALLGTLVQPYPELKERFERKIIALYALEQAIETHASFERLEAAHKEHLEYLAEKLA